jgi:cold-inducible RNA-binding protein
MSNKLYVGNISYQASEGDLEEAFGAHGKVVSVRIISDRDTGRSKGFGFVEMESGDQAEDCIQNLDGKEIAGREVRVSIARERQGGGGGGGGRRF